MDQFKRTTALQTSAAATLPPHRRHPQRITVTVSWRLHQKLLDRSDMEGRSLSNLAAHLLEVSCCRSLTTSSVGQPEA